MKNLTKSKYCGLVTRPVLAQMCGMSTAGLSYHLKIGTIERGKKRIGKRYFYTLEQAEEIQERIRAAKSPT